MSTLPKSFDPKEITNWQKIWEEKGLFSPRPGGSPFVVAIPPPNVTGSLHMGHALNSTIQDLLCRYYRLQGREVLWVPGTDHAGIATQIRVEKILREEEKTRFDLGRANFIERVWEWKEKYGNQILIQLKALGASCDFSRTRFTMDEDYSLAVRTAFVRLFEEGLIFRGERMINFCPRCRTALADIEVERKETKGKLYHISYPIIGEDTSLVIATTRPETMLGDTALCIHPEDKRYRSFQGHSARLPLMQREIPIITDEIVDVEFGTGVLKVTPAHDFNDFDLGRKHSLSFIQVINEKGRMTEKAGCYSGLDRFEAREKVLEDLRAEGLLKKEADYLVPLSVCARCSTVIEPLVSKQWFVDAPKLSLPAIEAMEKGKVVFQPARYADFYKQGLLKIREWCISRQIWWGHRIPAWFCEKGCPPTITIEPPQKCCHCSSTAIRQDEDVLDTWFSSALWPFAILGWPKKSVDLQQYYPTTLLSTARDIIFLWVARMVMMGSYFMGEFPFREVIVHPTILNKEGRRMSKSLGTGVDPLDLIEKYGADATRLGLMMLMQKGQDVRLSEDTMRAARFFCNKLWNATRLCLLLTKGNDFQDEGAQENIYAQWILHRLREVSLELDRGIAERAFSKAAMGLYHFVWNEWCDWYLEIAKEELSEGISLHKAILREGTMLILEWLYPFIPYLTEELNRALGEKLLVAERRRRETDPKWGYPKAKEKVQQIIKIVSTIRSLSACLPKKKRSFFFIGEKEWAELLPYLSMVKRLSKIESFQKCNEVPVGALTAKTEFGLVFTTLEKGELEQEMRRLQKKREILERELAKLKKRLSQPAFTSKAKPAIVEETRLLASDREEALKDISERLAALKGD